MPTIKQLSQSSKRLPKKRKTRVLLLKDCPQKRGTCVAIRNSISPRKPNSGKRKVAKVCINRNKFIIASIPGQGHFLQKFARVLIRGGRSKDIPGVRYKLIKGKYDFDIREKFPPGMKRSRKRSKYGISKFYKKDIINQDKIQIT
jgi:small subunit ribosomal protein S12